MRPEEDGFTVITEGSANFGDQALLDPPSVLGSPCLSWRQEGSPGHGQAPREEGAELPGSRTFVPLPPSWLPLCAPPLLSWVSCQSGHSQAPSRATSQWPGPVSELGGGSQHSPQPLLSSCRPLPHLLLGTQGWGGQGP